MHRLRLPRRWKITFCAMRQSSRLWLGTRSAKLCRAINPAAANKTNALTPFGIMLYLLVFTQFRTQNRCTLLLELL
ncbi:hypothetical protein GGE16_006099 [Rhizobium leguminosarum]|uniref:Uncharacterized protein n=1 Tax=Rhizobium leguminosarum TaxID=384 RepID=A0AAE2MR80_RHILE|nr:hypothetical protein [Rhizobium leguminosarum]MBB4435890.1 hypothetical protein [Rhizobium esperanzae]MBB4300387.1 hypothetical protein [Rhizobium leguminosarum]MBB4311682.1 hypothetical protein [Rhizobium leguminosarum]MBB4420678.1 hypothetical protein [Rhizobium leguminosarum]